MENLKSEFKVNFDEVLEKLKNQRIFFNSGATKSYQFRRNQLKTFLKNLKSFEDNFAKALHKDLGKSKAESFITETGFVYPEIKHTLKNLGSWMEKNRVDTPLAHFPSTSYTQAEPKGVVLIISPWNYPVNLALSPLVASIAAGNCSMIKPSEFTPHSNLVLKDFIEKTFDENLVSLVEGEGYIVIPEMIEQFRFDHIFFTGSPQVGRLVSLKAADQLIPVTLELGGKSPCIVDDSAKIKVAAKRIISGKFINVGQTCIAPDYLIVHEKVKPKLIEEMTKAIKLFFGKNPQESENYGRIINLNRFKTLQKLLEGNEIIYGGITNEENLFFGPTLIEGKMDSPIMQEEIFGPILPIFTYKIEGDIYEIIENNPHPLSLYVFSENDNFNQKITQEIPFGGGCINNTLVHIANPSLPFGGIMNSGSGRYHGKDGFLNLSNIKSITNTSSSIDIPLRYPPYSNFKEKVIKLFF